MLSQMATYGTYIHDAAEKRSVPFPDRSLRTKSMRIGNADAHAFWGGEKLREGLPADQPGGEWHAHGGHQSGNSRYAPFMGDAACSENSRSVPV